VCRVGHHHGEELGDAGDGGRGTALVQFFGPGGDLDAGDVAESVLSPAGQYVVAQIAAVALVGADPDVEGREPLLDPLGEVVER
jgi:hypothetical protein